MSLSPLTGIPILGDLDALAAKHQEDMDNWRRTSLDTVDQALLDPDNFYKDKPLAFHPDQQAARRAVTVRSYLTVANNGQPVTGDLYPSVFRDKIARERFDGRGVGSDEAFFSEIHKEAADRKDAKALSARLLDRASMAALRAGATAEPITWQDFLNEARTSPGYRREDEWRYLEAWQEQSQRTAAAIEPFREQLASQWQAMQTGKDADLGFLDQITGDDDTRAAMLHALAALIKELPAEQSTAVLTNLRKQVGRDAARIGGSFVDTLKALTPTAPGGLDLPPEYQAAIQSGEDAQPVLNELEDAHLRAKDFVADLDRMVQSDFDPVRSPFTAGSVADNLTKGLYTLPGVGATIAQSLVPGGQVFMINLMAEDNYQSTRQQLLASGVDQEKARQIAQSIALPAALIQAPLERLGAGAIAQRFPAVDAAVKNLTKNLTARFIARTAGGLTSEMVTETAQNYVPDVLQDLGHALGQDMPDVQWTGKGGVFEDFEGQTLQLLGALIPLAIMGAGKGYLGDRRLQTFAAAPDSHLLALGIAPDKVAAIRAANGIGQLEAAVDSAFESRDITSESAKAAQAQLEQEATAEAARITDARDNGILPRAEADPEGGWTLFDTVTGEELGKATTPEDAARIATAHANLSGEADADRIAAVVTAYQAAQASGDWSRDTGRSTATSLDLGTSLTTDDIKRRSAEARARVEAQERVDGGDGSIARQIFGESDTRQAEGQLRTVNRILEGGSVLDVFHEEAHGFRRAARAAGTITREDDLAFVRAIDAILADKTTREGQRLARLPENFDTLSEAEQDVALDEAVSKIYEAEILRTRKGGGQRPLPAGIVSRNLSALGRLLGNPRLGKFRAFISAIREHFGLSIDIASQIQRSLADGSLDREQYESYIAKLLGIDEQLAHEQQARDAESAILDGAELDPVASPVADADPFSLGSSRLGVLTGDAIRRIKDPVRRAQAMERISRRLEDLRLNAERLELLAGSRRLKRSLAREAAMRQAMRREELENEAWARHAAILTDDDLTKLKAQPGHAFLSDPKHPMLGRLLSKSAAAKKHPDLFQIHSSSSYDGSENVSRSVFGGTLTPDLAAQEMFESGLLKEPTTDALWQLLESEARHVANMRQVLESAKADLREARTVAKAETNAWLAEQTKGQQELTVTVTRQTVLEQLALLDAILSAAPPEIRGKVGGYLQAARITDADAGLEFFRERLAKVDTEIESWLKRQYDTEFRALLDRARPEKDEAGKRPRGKIGADIHDLFRELGEAMHLTAAETEAEALRLETLAAEEDLTPEQRSHATLQANLVRLVGDWSKATAARREAALLEATRIFEGGYLAHRIELSRQRERRNDQRHALTAATGKAGTREQRRTRAKKDDGTRTGRVLKTALSLLSFEQIVQKTFGENTPEAESLVTWERHAAHAKADALQHKLDLLDDLFASLAGGKFKGEQLRHKLADPDSIKVIDRAGREHTFSQLEAITATLMWRQEDGRRHMLGHVDDQGAPAGEWHFDQSFVDAIEDQLTDDAKAIRLHLGEQYAAEYERLNSVFRQLYGVSLPRHAFYSPLTVAPAQASAGQTLDPMNGSAMTGPGFTPGSLKTRSTSAIAEPRFLDAIQTYVAHSKSMEHWMAYAPFTTEAQALLNSREVANSVEASTGKESVSVLRGWLDYFAQGGTRDAAAHLAGNQLLNRVAGRAAAVALVGRVSVLAIQSTQLAAALAEMPATAYLTRLARLFAGRLDWSAAIRSEYIQRRKNQMPPVVQQAMEGLASSKPNRLKYLARKMGETISGADALFTAGTYAIVHDYHLQQAKALNLSDPHAYARQAAERSTDRVAQPVRPGTRSLFEVTGTNPAVRILWSFASDSRQKLMLAAYALGSNKPAGEKARAIAVTWLAGGLLSSVIRATMRDLRDDDDDEFFDSDNWNPARLALASLTGPFQGLPFLGDIIEGSVFKLFGEYLPDGNLFSGGQRAVEKLGDLVKGDGPDDLEAAAKDAETILSGAGLLSESAAAASSFSHLIRDLIGFLENLDGPQ